MKAWLQEIAKRLLQDKRLQKRHEVLKEGLIIDKTKTCPFILETITDFNLEARYPDERFSFKKKCTREFTETYLHKIEEIRRWLLQKIQP